MSKEFVSMKWLLELVAVILLFGGVSILTGGAIWAVVTTIAIAFHFNFWIGLLASGLTSSLLGLAIITACDPK